MEQKAYEYISQLADALKAAQKKGIFHGNLFPGNVYLDKEEC